VILTADDFGLAVSVNEAVERAHQEGVLTAASLMVGAGAAADAVERARRLPRLGVGLHVVLVEGRPVLAPGEVPDLVGPEGGFSNRLVRSGVRFFFLPRVRRQLAAEIRAQFEAFRATGLPLDHVNAHNHMHLHPTVLGLILSIGRDYGIQAVRTPYEPPLRSWRATREGLGRRLATAAFLAPWTSLVRRRLARRGLRTNDWVFGLNDTGKMTAQQVERLIRQLPDGISELYFHPATGRSPELDRSMPGYQHEGELAALLSPAVAQALRDSRALCGRFSDLV
jgi:hopanoid biosynthesis associated protein HpnK